MKENIEKRKSLNNNYELRYFNDEKGREIISLFSGSSYQSLSYTEESLKYELYHDYSKLYDIIANFKENVGNSLVLGGGGFSYPKYYISKYPEKKMDVIENSKEVIDIAYKYFYLSDLYQEYDKDKTRLHIYALDALDYIKSNKKIYDAIFIDLYIDIDPLIDNFSFELLKEITSSLAEDGCLFINYIIKNKESSLDNYHNLITKLTRLYKNIRSISTSNFDIGHHGNVLIMASNSDIKITDDFNYIDVTV